MRTQAHQEKILTALQTMAKTHRGEIHSIYTTWEVIEVYNARYESKIQELVPFIVIDFK